MPNPDPNYHLHKILDAAAFLRDGRKLWSDEKKPEAEAWQELILHTANEVQLANRQLVIG